MAQIIIYSHKISRLVHVSIAIYDIIGQSLYHLFDKGLKEVSVQQDIANKLLQQHLFSC